MTLHASQHQSDAPSTGESSQSDSAKSRGGRTGLSVGAPVAKLHYLKFYPESWIAEIGLRMCSLAARGLWIDLICHMAKSPEHGVLLTMGGKPISDAQIPAVLGVDPETVASSLAELESNRVLSRREDGAIFSRRMVRDHAEYVRQSAYGSKASRPKKGGLEGTPEGSLQGTPQGTPEAPLEGTLEACVDSSFYLLGSTSKSSSETKRPESGGSADRYIADRKIRTEGSPPGFTRFIADYPPGRSKDRPATLALWESLGCEDVSGAVLAGLERWKVCDDWRDGCIEKSENFLRLRLWEQEPPAPKAAKGGGGWL